MPSEALPLLPGVPALPTIDLAGAHRVAGECAQWLLARGLLSGADAAEALRHGLLEWPTERGAAATPPEWLTAKKSKRRRAGKEPPADPDLLSATELHDAKCLAIKDGPLGRMARTMVDRHHAAAERVAAAATFRLDGGPAK